MSDYDVLSAIRFMTNPACNPKGAAKNSVEWAENTCQAVGVIEVYSDCVAY
jgi:hypothetical protein